jgi:hypothetical protein
MRHTGSNSYVISSSSQRLSRVRPVDVELPADATEDIIKANGGELASGMMNQVGPPRLSAVPLRFPDTSWNSSSLEQRSAQARSR